jgi:subtilisin family serine protease
MAAPHVAGVIALYLSQYPTATPAQVKKDIVCFSTKYSINDIQNSPNALLYSFTGHNVAIENSPSTETCINNGQNTCTTITDTFTSKTIKSYPTFISTPGTHRAWLTSQAGGIG